jgi:hypothetical protein
MVGVLVLVDEDVREPATVGLGDVGMVLKQVDRLGDEIVEVQCVRLGEPGLITGERSAKIFSVAVLA